jgi:uridine kinase
MIQTYSALAHRLAKRFAHLRKQASLFVGVDGPGGAGKSTFAQGLTRALEGQGLPAQVVHMDDFYRPSRERHVGALESLPPASDFDWERLLGQVLVPLMEDRPARYQRYNWPSDTLAEWHSIPPGGAVIVEGISALREELSRFYHFRVWVDSPRPTRLARGVDRDGEAQRSTWENHWMPAEERYFSLHRPQDKAELWVDGSGAPGLEPLVEFIQLENREIQPDE